MTKWYRRLSRERLSRAGRKLPAYLVTAAYRSVLGTVTGIRTGARVAALTFDDGPDPVATPRILDLLERHGARGTFFMRGTAAAAHPEIVRRAVAAGHAVGNHTWDHPSMPNISRAERKAQLRKCSAALGAADNRLFRPPYGHQSPASRLDALLAGYRVIGWTGHAHDYLDRTAQQITAGLDQKLAPGAILLMHDALFPPIRPEFADRGPLIAGLAAFLAGHPDYRFVTVPELLTMGRAVRAPWIKPGDIEWLNSLNGGDTRQYGCAHRGAGGTARALDRS